jgi:hypothetical protein
VPVIDAMFVLATQTLQPQDQVLRVPDLDLLHADACFNLLAD